MKLALTGATGFVGSALMDLALAGGFELAALTRKAQPERKNVSWVQGDLADKTALEHLVSDADVVLHVAGVVNAPDASAFEAGNVTGTLNLLEAARAGSTKRFVFVSSLAAREPDLSEYGASKARAEKLVRASGRDWTIVRPPAVYGPRDREMLDLFRSAKFGFVPTPKDGKLSVLHVEDLAELLLALVPSGEAVTGATFEPDDGRAGGWSHYELARAIGFAMGRRPKVLGLSRRTMERAAGLDGLLRRKRAKLTLDRVAYFNHPDWVVSPDACPPGALWHPEIETREGLKATVTWYREAGWL